MTPESESNLRLEIGHVLFIDLVGYSKLLIEEQKERLRQLTDIVLATGQVAKATNEQLVRLPTGDGMALVFRNSSEEPARCALEIAQALKPHPEIAVRMGIHSGPVSEVTDVNGRTNIAGAGINMAQRVMDCGDAGHILLSQRVADDLAQYRQWSPNLHDLGECEVKHGVRLKVVNLFTDEIGNPEAPQKFRQAKEKKQTSVAGRSPARSKPLLITLAILICSLIGLGIVAVIFAPAATNFFSQKRAATTPNPTLSASPTPTAPAIPEKSIAVLPFENLSRDPDNAYFATGIQDEILTRLAKIGALKVISHTSTQQYGARPADLPGIARQLAVANILEGSVQKAADQVHINVQLIRAATDDHLWAESYDRKLDNIFGVESEVATAVAEALKAKLTGAEQHTVGQRSTNNPQAYDAYLRGLAYSLRVGYSPVDNLDAIKYFGAAVKLDPKFALAWAWLGRENAKGYFNKIGDNPPALRDDARQAANKAVELQPDLGEAYLAQGYSRYYCERDYHSAIALFEKARELLPNNSQVPLALALVCRRLGEWQRSLDYFRDAVQIDPRDTTLLTGQAETLEMLRQYPAALKALDQVLDILPDNLDLLAFKASIYQEQGKLVAAAALLSLLHPRPGLIPFRVQIAQWTYERRYAEAIPALKTAAAGSDRDTTEDDRINIKVNLAWMQQFTGDTAAAQATWQQARSESESYMRRKGLNFATLELASANVALGDKAEAFAIVERAAAEFPPTKDAMAAAGFSDLRARVAVQAGENDLAIQQIAIAARSPGGAVSYGDLKLNPLWDSLRGDPRFEQIVASLAPK